MYQDIFGRDNFFIELQDHGIPAQRKVMPDLLEVAREVGAPLLATNDSHYTFATEAETHDVLLCIQTGANRDDPGRFRFESEENYLKTSAEMRSLFPADEFPGACDNTLEVAERCDLQLEFGRILLPQFPVPAGATEASFLRDLVLDGARHRYGDPLPETVVERIDYELRVIGDMGFSAYFLDRLGPHQICQGTGHPHRPRPGERRRLDRGVLPGDHQARPARVRPHLRAIPQPRSPPDARHRHGLRRALPGRDDPLLRRAVRVGPRRPDRHVLHHQGPPGAARRRPRPRVPVRSRRPGGQADAAAHPRRGGDAPGLPRRAVAGAAERGGRPLPRRRRAPPGVRHRSRGPPGDRHRPRARGAAPPGLDPRRRGGHLPDPAHRDRPHPAKG